MNNATKELGERRAFHTMYSSGMTIRQHMATHIMAGILASSKCPPDPAKTAVIFADALLQELVKDQNGG